MYRLFFIIILILFAPPGMAGEKRYRVEVLVLSHIHHEAIPAAAGRLRDFSASLDFLQPESDEEIEDDEAVRDEDTSTELIVFEQAGINQAGANVVAVEDMSDVMRDAWRRLSLGAPFRPEQYLSWAQSADEPFPSLRVHDLKVILIDDPYVALREIDLIEGGLPDPTLFYRLDGTVVLRRTRFLHLDIDLELRQTAFGEPVPTPALILRPEGETVGPEQAPPNPFLIHKLKQSRQVKSQRMEYFDSPVLGVLAWITPFELEDEFADAAESSSD